MPTSLLADLTTALQAFTSEHRLYDIEIDGGAGQGLMVEAFSLQERLSQPWQMELVCLSLSAHLDIAALLGQPLHLHIAQADGSRITRSGRISSAQADDADGGLARYRLTVHSWMSQLAHTRRSQVFQDKTLQQIIDAIFGAYPAAQWDWADDTTQHLAQSPFTTAQGQRSYTVQYRETDLAFVQRLLAEEGLVWRSQPDDKVIILADTPRQASCPDNPQSKAAGAIKFHRADSIEDQDAIQALGAVRRLPSATLTTLAWDYKAKRAVATSLPTAAAYGGPNAPRLEAYDPTSAYAYPSTQAAERALELAQQALEARHKTFLGRSTVRSLRAGQQMHVKDSPLDALDDADATHFTLTAITHAGLNNLPKDLSERIAKRFDEEDDLLAPWVDAHVREQTRKTGYGNAFEALRAQVPWRALQTDGNGQRLNPKPTTLGPQTATVVGPQGQTSANGADELHMDRLGRVRIQFHFQRQQQGPQTSNTSTWVRVVQSYAGPGMGLQFIPRIGQEVLVDFIEGDIDRPIVMGALYNGQGQGHSPITPGGKASEADTSAFKQSTNHRPAGQDNTAGGHSPAWHGAAPGALDAGGQANAAALSGIKSKEFGGAGYNQLVFDDSTGQLRTQLATTQHASQLNLGHLIHQADNHRGSVRGEGFELRTDAYGAVRAAQGLLISTWRQDPTNPAGDNAAGIALANQYKTLATTFDKAAKTHQTVTLADVQGSFKASKASLSDKEAPAKAMLTSLKGMVNEQAFEPAKSDAANKRTDTQDKLPHTADALIAIAAQAGLATVAGQDVQLAAADTVHLGAGQDFNLATGGAYRLHTGQAIGILGGAIQPGQGADGKGLTLIAGQGDIEVQAQASTLQVAAKQDVAIQSEQAHIDWAAAKKITLAVSGGASITLQGGNITIECPGTITVKASVKSFEGPQKQSYPLPQLPNHVCVSCLLNAMNAGSSLASV